MINEETAFNNEKKRLTEALELITRRMFETRPQKEVVLHPYTKPGFVERNLRSDVIINLKKVFPKAKCGDYTYVSVDMKVSDTSEYKISTIGAEELFVNGTAVCPCEEKRNMLEKEFNVATVKLEKGFNRIVFKCICTKDGFFLDYIIGHVFWPAIWICDYLLWARDTVPMAEFFDEQGFCISGLASCGEKKTVGELGIVFPKAPKCDGKIDFCALYGEGSGEYAFALSYAQKSGVLDIKSENDISVFVNGKKSESLEVCRGDEIFVVCKRGKNSWGFESFSNDILQLPFVETKRTEGIHWLLLGGFANADLPEAQFKKPFVAADGETFWRFAEEDLYLRPYLDTCFFGQWFYGLMVGEYGLLCASEYDKKCYDYFKSSMSVLAEYYRYMQFDKKLFGDAGFLKRSVELRELDPIGTIGMNLYELYIREKDENLKSDILYVLNELTKSIYENIPRMPDGTFYRIGTMWADDTYMSCPFLVRMGSLTGEEKYYDEVCAQLKNFKKYLYIKESGLFSHIYFPLDKKANRVSWGRGNGWIYLTLAEVLEHLPTDYAQREDIALMFKDAVSALVPFQDKNGMWHQVLDIPDTYAETSCTAIFAVAISKGIKLGILPKKDYVSVVERAVLGILENSVLPNGDIDGVCRGSGCCYDWQYYAELGTICGDDHGTGVVLAAICELLNLKY